MFQLRGRCKVRVLLLLLAMVMVTRQASYYTQRAPYWGSYQYRVVSTLGGNLTGTAAFTYYSVPFSTTPSNIAEMAVVLSSYQLAAYPTMQFRITQPTYSSATQSATFGVQVVAPSAFAFLRFFIVYNTQLSTPYLEINVNSTTCSVANGAVGASKSEALSSPMRLTGAVGTTFIARTVLSSIMLTNNNQTTHFALSVAAPTSGGPLSITLTTNSSITEIIVTTFILASTIPIEYVFYVGPLSLSRTDSISTKCGSNFNIPPKNGPVYNQNCTVGVTGVQDDNLNIWRSTYFDVTGTGFTNCSNNAETAVSGTMTINLQAFCSYQVVCTSPNEYYDPSNTTSCVPCSSLTALCKTCNITTCITCDIYHYPLKIGAANSCPTCNQTNCTLCLSVSICGACTNASYLANETCFPCILLSHCVYCSSGSFCLSCENGYGPDPTGTCYPCTGMMPQCAICQNFYTCSLCSTNYYVSPGASSCTACDYSVPKCATCVSNTNCTSCSNGYFMQSPISCLSCAQSVPNCTACTSLSNCTGCTLGYYISTPTSCLPCGITGCINCTTSSHCVSCSLGYYLDGTFQCSKCKDSNCFNCSSGTNCLLCASDYKLETDNVTCSCRTGWPVTGVCVNVTACVTAAKVSGTPTCLFCNSLNYFIISSGQCVCQTGYKQTADQCSTVCGDGIRIASEDCDDGNTDDGDGCSSACHTEGSYNCSSSSGSYKCKYSGDFSISLQYILRAESDNSATYYFAISPTPYNLQLNNYSQYSYLNISNQFTSYKGTSIAYTNGMIVVGVDFTQDIEGLLTELSISFDSSYFNSSRIRYSFASVGTNQPLIVSAYSQHVQYLKIMAYAVVGLAGVLLVASVGLEKMIGIETVNLIQVVVFSKLIYVQNDILVSGGIINLKYINGYNDIGKDLAHTHEVPLPFRRLEFNSDYILNFQTGLLLMAVSLLLLIIMEVYRWRTMQQLRITKKGSIDQLKLAEQRLQEKGRFLYERVFLMVACVTLFDCLAAVRMQSRSIIGESHYTYFALNLLGMLCSLLYIFAILTYEALNVGKEHTWLAFFCSYSEHYIGYYLCYIMLLTPFLVGGETFTGYMGAFVVSGVVLVHLVIMAIWRPYKQPFHNFTIIFNNAVLLFVLVVSILMIETSIPQDTQLIWAYIIMGLLLLVEAFAFIRLYLASKKAPKEGQRVKGEEDELSKGMDKIEKEYLNPHKRNQKALSKSNHDDDELARLRNRLKKQFKAKNIEQPQEI